jgi:hypothetical protein
MTSGSPLVSHNGVFCVRVDLIDLSDCSRLLFFVLLFLEIFLSSSKKKMIRPYLLVFFNVWSPSNTLRCMYDFRSKERKKNLHGPRPRAGYIQRYSMYR